MVSLLQLSDLAVERVHVLLDDERQLLDLPRPVVEERFAARQQRQLFQFCIRVAEKRRHPMFMLYKPISCMADQ